MKVTLLALVSLACSFQLSAQDSGHFCSDRQNANFVKDLTLDSKNLISFRNRGGIGMAGVCWWHSRFERNALYLTIYKPELAKPTNDEAIELIKQIRDAENVIEIPGYNNFFEFTSENKALIQSELEAWQLGDGLLRFAWIDGLSGDAKVEAWKLKGLMDEIYNDVEVNKNISYNKLQAPGILAHAWSVVHMEKVKGGYDLEILDSNTVGYSEHYEYREGDTFMRYHMDHAEVKVSTLQNLMDIAYQRDLQKDYKNPLILPGLEYHRWTVRHVKKVDGGYDLDVVVYSKNRETQNIIYKYKNGDARINYSVIKEEMKDFAHSFSFTPYLERTDEMDKINNAIARHCSSDESIVLGN
ncbi:MAG: hypothetical protein PHY93_17615 [Bacteriovorax sp.]|nr:hypothetical protein [Bacteriovorax sp.]